MSRKSKVESRKPKDGQTNSVPGSRPSTLDLRLWFALAFGFFLGLCLWKFGNPVVLDHKIIPPATLADFWNDPWPTHWTKWFFSPFVVAGAILIFGRKKFWPQTDWLLLLPLIWLGWQQFSAMQTVDADLTAATLWQFWGCVVCYFFGAILFASERAKILLLVGIFIAFTYCLVRAIDQHLFEFPRSYQALMQGERAGWTNSPPQSVAEMKLENIIITTNGADVANPVILKKFAEGRVNGTLVYPNALAGAILLLFPAALALAFRFTKKLKPLVRYAAIGLILFLGGAAFYWTGSKLGWLLGIGVAGFFLLRLNWPKKLKIAAVAMVFILGLGIFAVRFQHYFAKGATSVSARFDYWRAAVQTTLAKPIFGSGPGTFYRSYESLKSPDEEMARLAHNDYLEQFSDSGVAGGLAYAAWILLALSVAGKKIWRGENIFLFALFAGVLAWFAQGLGEFGLYIPASAWTAFTLLGSLIGRNGIEFDKEMSTR